MDCLRIARGRLRFAMDRSRAVMDCLRFIMRRFTLRAHFCPGISRNDIFLGTFVFAKKTKCVSNDRSRRDDQNAYRIIKIGAILKG